MAAAAAAAADTGDDRQIHIAATPKAQPPTDHPPAALTGEERKKISVLRPCVHAREQKKKGAFVGFFFFDTAGGNGSVPQPTVTR